MDPQPMARAGLAKQTNYLIRPASVANAWSLQEIRQLRALAQAGTPLQSIASQLGRSRSAIRNKAGFHAIPLKG